MNKFKCFVFCFILSGLTAAQDFSRTFVFKVENKAYSFTDIQNFALALSSLTCAMEEPRISLLFTDFLKSSRKLKDLNSLRSIKKLSLKEYKNIVNFFKVLEYAKKQMVVVREKLVSSVQDLGQKRSCPKIKDQLMTEVLRLEVFFTSRFRLEKGTDKSKSQRSALGLIESIEKQILSKDFEF